MSDRGRRFVAQAVAVAVGIVLILAFRGFFSNDDGGDDVAAPDGGPRGDCLQLAVTASSEKAALLGELAADYNDTDPSAGGECVNVVVTSKSSGATMDALSRGWDEALDGPRPDVWSPAASSWVVLLRQRTAAADRPDLVPAEYENVAWSPLVIAMPRPMAEALGWPKAQIGWETLFDLAEDPEGWGAYGHPEWGAFKLGKTNPNFSTSGLHALLGSYFAATGLSSDLSIPQDRGAEGPRLRAGRRVLGRALRRHLPHVPFEPAAGRRPRRGPDVHLRGDDRGEVGLGLQPGQPRGRLPRRSATTRQALRALGRDLSRRGDARSPTTRSCPSQPHGSTTRHEGGGGRVPRVPAGQRAAGSLQRVRLPRLRRDAGTTDHPGATGCCRSSRSSGARSALARGAGPDPALVGGPPQAGTGAAADRRLGIDGRARRGGGGVEARPCEGGRDRFAGSVRPRRRRRACGSSRPISQGTKAAPTSPSSCRSGQYGRMPPTSAARSRA